jgi:hypothetical protein
MALLSYQYYMLSVVQKEDTWIKALLDYIKQQHIIVNIIYSLLHVYVGSGLCHELEVAK